MTQDIEENEKTLLKSAEERYRGALAKYTSANLKQNELKRERDRRVKKLLDQIERLLKEDDLEGNEEIVEEMNKASKEMAQAEEEARQALLNSSLHKLTPEIWKSTTKTTVRGQPHEHDNHHIQFKCSEGCGVLEFKELRSRPYYPDGNNNAILTDVDVVRRLHIEAVVEENLDNLRKNWHQQFYSQQKNK